MSWLSIIYLCDWCLLICFVSKWVHFRPKKGLCFFFHCSGRRGGVQIFSRLEASNIIKTKSYVVCCEVGKGGKIKVTISIFLWKLNFSNRMYRNTTVQLIKTNHSQTCESLITVPNMITEEYLFQCYTHWFLRLRLNFIKYF